MVPAPDVCKGMDEEYIYVCLFVCVTRSHARHVISRTPNAKETMVSIHSATRPTVSLLLYQELR